MALTCLGNGLDLQGLELVASGSCANTNLGAEVYVKQLNKPTSSAQTFVTTTLQVFVPQGATSRLVKLAEQVEKTTP